MESAKLFNDIYRGRKVFVTGHTGFKGSWLVFWLTQLGAEVIGYSKDIPTQPSHYELLNLKITSIVGDILDREKLESSLREHQPDIVFHMAAQPLVRESYLYPVETFQTNVMGTVNVLEACRKVESIKAILNITSDKCYENKEWDRPYTEEDPMGGHDPYSASKGCAELVSSSYRNSFFNLDKYDTDHRVLLANVRAGNVIGGGDWAKDRLIPDTVRATSQSKVVQIRNPHAVRPWQHVLEPVSGYLHLGWKLLEGKKEFADNWNFGPNADASLTVDQVLKHAQENWDKVRYEIRGSGVHLHEAGLLLLDSTKAREKLKWQSVWSGPQTFEKTMNWYKSYYESGQVSSPDDLKEYILDAQAISVDWVK